MAQISGRQISAARALLGLSQAYLAEKARISIPTLKRMEGSSGEVSGLRNNVEAVRAALEAAGVEFLNHGQPGVRLRKGATDEEAGMGSMSYRPERQDLLAASRLHHLAAIMSRRIAIGTSICAVAAGTLGYLIAQLSRDAPTVAVVLAALALASIVVALALAHLVRPRLVVRRLLKEQRSLQSEYTFTWTEHGYAVRGATVSSDLSWSHYIRWREDADVILLYQNWQSYQFGPKRIMPAGAADMIRARLAAAGVRRAPLFLS